MDEILRVKYNEYEIVAYKDKRFVEVYRSGEECQLQSFWFDTFQINDIQEIKQYIYGYVIGQVIPSWKTGWRGR